MPTDQDRGTGCGGELNRRDFVRLGGLGLAAWGAAAGGPAIAGPFTPEDTRDHFVPLDKKLAAAWVEALFARGEPTWYEGTDLKTIGMPVGGICAGQVYLSGDGRLIYWDIFNQNINTGFGAVNYKVGRMPTEVVVGPDRFVAAPAIDQGAAVRVQAGDRTLIRPLDARGFRQVRFCGEYPIGLVEYRDPEVPIAVDLEAFSPFIPLNPEDSAMPATVLRYTVRNTSAGPVEVTLAGWLQNAVLHFSKDLHAGSVDRTNAIIRGEGIAQLVCAVEPAAAPALPARAPRVLADFEGESYGDWKAEGEAFGSRPAHGTLERQQAVSGFRGRGLVNTFLGGDDRERGKLTSPPFTIDRTYLGFLIGGGRHEDRTCINLVVEGKVVRTAVGQDAERLQPQTWNVAEFSGKPAQLEIVDAESGPWGHINVDQIELRDTPMTGALGRLDQLPDHGTMALTLLGADGLQGQPALPAGVLPDVLFAGADLAAGGPARVPADGLLRGALGTTFALEPGAARTVTLVVSWCLPNLYRDRELVRNRYATRFPTAAAAGQYVAANLDLLAAQTRLWHDTYYDSTLPRWLLDRVHSTVGNLATTTCQWWGNGRFWAWEGGGCCHGTCGHVWNYAHALARLFPTLERSVREMQDFAPGVGLIPETGEIRFRGEGWDLWAGDAQGGYILKAYREHQNAPDPAFLTRTWPNIRKAVQFLLDQDGNADGLIEGRQHQTYDQDYYGANTFVGALYLGALRAAEEMAREVGDPEFATRCRAVFEAGRENSVKRLFNGEYFIQKVDLAKHPKYQYADGCLADQVFGQGWAHQVALGYLYPPETVRQALSSVWKYCWAPDVRRQNEAHPPQRWFAYPGEAGLFTCTWPKSKHMGPNSTVYRDEVWTGIEYQVAGHMAYEGMLTEALAICRAVHERYHPAKRNPYNEIECGDHYARALASWGVLLSLAGFKYHGPRRHLGFAPRLTPEAFRCAFTTAEGWGRFDQRREGARQVHTIAVRWGRLPLATLACELPADRTARRVTAAGRPDPLHFEQQGQRVVVTLPEGFTLATNEALEVTIET